MNKTFNNWKLMKELGYLPSTAQQKQAIPTPQVDTKVEAPIKDVRDFVRQDLSGRRYEDIFEFFLQLLISKGIVADAQELHDLLYAFELAERFSKA